MLLLHVLLCVLEALFAAMGPPLVQLHLIFRRQAWAWAIFIFSIILMAASLMPIDLILSCSVCQAPLSSIYDGNDYIGGLRDGSDPHHGQIIKLWLTECTHLICGKHFEGGGVPFYSEQQTPRAPCPLCSADRNDRSNKDLFFVNGSSKGQYDDNIPESYFQTPPVSLSVENETKYDALLFQYLALIRFGSKTYEKACRLETALQRWEDKKPEIVRSLSNVAPLRDELCLAGSKLKALGHNVSSIESVLNIAGASLQQDLQQHQQPSSPRRNHNQNLSTEGNSKSSPARLDAGTRLAQGSVSDLISLHKEASRLRAQFHGTLSDPMAEDAHSAKRKHADSLNLFDQMVDIREARHYHKGHSRDLMPPPPIPVQQRPMFVGRVDEPNGSRRQIQVIHTPRRQLLNPLQEILAQFPSPPPNRPLPQPPTQTPWYRIRFNTTDNRHVAVNAEPNRVQLPAPPANMQRSDSSRDGVPRDESPTLPLSDGPSSWNPSVGDLSNMTHVEPPTPSNTTHESPAYPDRLHPPASGRGLSASLPRGDRRPSDGEPDVVRRSNSHTVVGEMRPYPTCPASRGPSTPSSVRRAAQR